MPKANKMEPICKIFNLPLIEKAEKNNIKKIRIFNIPVYKKYKRNGYNIRKYLFGLIKTKTNQNHKKIYLFGIQILCKKLLSDYERLRNEIKNASNNLFENISITHFASVKHSYLEKYKYMYKDKEIVLVACGPTINYLKDYDPDKIYIGVNRAFKIKNIPLDYLFVQDQFPEGMAEVDEYEGNNCHKFYGILSNSHCRRFSHCIRIPHFCISRPNASVYYLESIVSNNFAYDISVEPFGEFKSTIFSALQFALYTHPKRIYLAGCDCSSNYFYGEDDIHKYPYLISEWMKMKKIISEIFPDIEVISINPVGLKGMFKDIYTNNNGEYTDENGNIIDLNDNKTGREFSKEKYYTCY